MTMDLNDIWSIYFHDPNDKDWTMKSYHHLSMLSTVDDFWVVHKAMQDKVADGMFFIMREYIFPCWDDPENKEGGCFSIKVGIYIFYLNECDECNLLFSLCSSTRSRNRSLPRFGSRCARRCWAKS